MSHPYWPQPRYLYQRSVPTGPYPDAMGDYGSRYTHGSFSRQPSYALPPYVARERTGLEGDGGHPFEHGSSYYGGFGQDIISAGSAIIGDPCDIDRVISDYASRVLSLLGIPNLEMSFLGQTFSSHKAAISALQSLRPHVQRLFEIAAEGAHGEFKTYFSLKVAPALVPPINAVIKSAPMNLPLISQAWVSNTVSDALWSITAAKVANCGEQRIGTGTVPGAAPQLMELHLKTSPAQLELARKLTWNPVDYAIPVTAQVRCTREGGYWDIDPYTGQGRCIPKPGKLPVAKKTGVGTVAILGAAALAALVLLRR